MKFSPLVLFLLSTLSAFAQADTTTTFFSKEWEPTTKDSAAYISKVVRKGDKWYKQTFRLPSYIIYSDGWYEDEKTDKADGFRRFYGEDGVIRDSSIAVHGNRVSDYALYPNHKISGYATFGEKDRIIKQVGYAEDGSIIADYVFEKQAEFPGGDAAWKAYLVKGLQTRQPKAYLKGKMSGTVVMTFKTGKDGTIQDVKVYRSSGFPELDEHATNVVKSSPRWAPAIQYNKPVIYSMRQSLTYAPVQ